MGERDELLGERRSSPRVPLSARVDVSGAPEERLPHATTIDLSVDGVLLAFPEPVGLEPGVRVVVSLVLTDGHLHSLATVQRADRGADYRTYVAVTFDGLNNDDRLRLTAALEV